MPELINGQSYYVEKEAAFQLGVAPATMRSWRRRGKGPRAFRRRDRFILYAVDDIHQFAEKEEKIA